MHPSAGRLFVFASLFAAAAGCDGGGNPAAPSSNRAIPDRSGGSAGGGGVQSLGISAANRLVWQLTGNPFNEDRGDTLTEAVVFIREHRAHGGGRFSDFTVREIVRGIEDAARYITRRPLRVSVVNGPYDNRGHAHASRAIIVPRSALPSCRRFTNHAIACAGLEAYVEMLPNLPSPYLVTVHEMGHLYGFGHADGREFPRNVMRGDGSGFGEFGRGGHSRCVLEAAYRRDVQEAARCPS